MLTLEFVPISFEAVGAVSIAVLQDRHMGETATLVGKGPSLLRLRAEDIGPGPVIVLNEAILHVQSLELPNAVYSLQKDGCAVVDEHTPRPCTSCAPLGWQRFPVINPVPEIAVIFSQHLSPWCLHDRANRYAFTDDQVGAAGRPHTMSTLNAIGFARHLGCTALVLAGFDHLVTGETSYALGGGKDAAAEAIARDNLAQLKPQALAALTAFGPYRFVWTGDTYAEVPRGEVETGVRGRQQDPLQGDERDGGDARQQGNREGPRDGGDA